MLTVAAILIAGNLYAQRMTVEEYVAAYKDAAISQMKRLGVPASIILAQGILETENGNSDLVKRSNNHFGIKCKSTWTGPTVSHTDDAPNECFRKYATAEESYADHSNYLFNTPRYASLFKLSPTDYKGWAYGLKRAGYATNPRYPQILIGNIEKYNLQQYNSEQPGGDYAQAPASAVDIQATAITSQPPMQEGDPEQQNKDNNAFRKIFAGRKNKSNQLFNRLRAVMVFKGTSLLAVATENNVALAKLLEYNDMDNDGLAKADQWIYLEKKHKEGNRDLYTTLADESLHDISQNNGIQLNLLADYNNLSQNSFVKKGTAIRLRPNAQLPILPAQASAPKPAPPVVGPAQAATLKYHTVEPKEGLYAISKKYNVSIAEIKEWNQLSSDDLKLGQQLIIAK